MSFEPVEGQYYQIVAKHSGQLLEIAGNVVHRGAAIHQGVWADLPYQQFQFHREGDYFNIVSRSSGRSFDVPDSKSDDGLGIIQWDRHDYSPNQQFSFLPAGSGYYYISSRPTEKFVCVQDGKSGIGVPLVQHLWNGGDHFLFSFVPCAPVVSARALRQAVLHGADPIRDAVIALTGLIPTAGGAVKFLLGVLWKDSNGTIIEQTREYVRAVCKEMIDEYALQELANRITGLKNVIEQYSINTSGSMMDSLITQLEASQPHFFNTQFPEKTLPHLLTLGTMHLTALRERYDDYEKLYGKKPDKPEELLKNLNDRVDVYVEGGKTARQKTAERRQKYIEFSQHIAYRDGVAHHDYFLVEDKFDGWRFVADVGQIDRSRELGLKMFEERKRQVKEEFDAELDALFGPALVWKYVKPKLAEKPATVRVVTSSPLFGATRGTEDAGGPSQPDHPIDEILVRANNNDRIHGISIGRSGSFRTIGKMEGTEYALKCAAGEYFNGVYGNHGGEDGLYSIYFVTNKGRIVGQGRRGAGTPFGSEPPVGSDTRLEDIFAWVNGNRIEGVGFKWGYARKQ